MGGCAASEIHDDKRTPEEKARDERLERRKRDQKEKQELFLLRLKQLVVSKSPIPDFLTRWDKLEKGPKVNDQEIEHLKQKIDDGGSSIILSTNLVRRLIQTIESKNEGRTTGFTEALPPVGKEIIVGSNGWDDFPGIVITHLPKGTCITYEPGYPNGDGNTPGKMHVHSGSLDDLDINSLLQILSEAE